VTLVVTSKINESFSSGAVQTTSTTLAPKIWTLYVAAVQSRVLSGPPNVPTLSGAGLDWELLTNPASGDTASQLTPSGLARLSVFVAMGQVGLTTEALTVDFDDQSQSHITLQVSEWQRVSAADDGAIALVQFAKGSGSATTAAATLASFFDATNNAGYFVNFHETAEAVTPEAGWTEIAEKQQASNGTLQSEWRTGQDTSPTATWASSGGYAAIAIEVQPAWVAPVQGNPTAAKWNAYVAGDLDFLYRGYGMWLPTPSQSIDGQSKVHGFNLGAFLVPVMCKDAITLNSIAYRSDTANGTIDLGVYQDDGNGTTCSKVATTDLTPMPGGSGAKQITLENPAPLTPWTKYWLAIGFAITVSGSGGSLGTVLGTDGVLLGLCKRAVNVMPLPTVITFDTVAPTCSPCLAGLP